MSRRRRRAPIPVTLVQPAEPPAQEEIDAILMAADSIVGTAGGASPGPVNCPVPLGESANQRISEPASRQISTSVRFPMRNVTESKAEEMLPGALFGLARDFREGGFDLPPHHWRGNWR